MTLVAFHSSSISNASCTVCTSIMPTLNIRLLQPYPANILPSLPPPITMGLGSIVENGHAFKPDFLNKCTEEIENIMAIPEEDTKEEGKEEK